MPVADAELGYAEGDVRVAVIGDETGVTECIKKGFDGGILVVGVEEVDAVQIEVDVRAAKSARCASTFNFCVTLQCLPQIRFGDGVRCWGIHNNNLAGRCAGTDAWNRASKSAVKPSKRLGF